MTDPRRKEVDPDERRFWITPDQYKLLGRPLTDPPIGGSRGSQSKRAIDAELSAIVTESLGYVPEKSRERALDRPQSDEKAERVHRDQKQPQKPGRAK